MIADQKRERRSTGTEHVDPVHHGCEGGWMSTDTTEVQVSNNEAESRYEATLDGGPVGTAAYERSGDSITFTHTVVDQDVEGQGIGSTLIRYALDDARRQHLAVVPQCEFVAAFIEDHPDYRALTV